MVYDRQHLIPTRGGRWASSKALTQRWRCTACSLRREAATCSVAACPRRATCHEGSRPTVSYMTAIFTKGIPRLVQGAGVREELLSKVARSIMRRGYDATCRAANAPSRRAHDHAGVLRRSSGCWRLRPTDHVYRKNSDQENLRKNGMALALQDA